jgi:hypothetical protein
MLVPSSSSAAHCDAPIILGDKQDIVALAQ